MRCRPPKGLTTKVLRDRFKHWRWDPPLRTARAVMAIALAAIVVLVWFQFRGDFTQTTKITLLAARAGLSMDPGSKVTYNGVEIGRVADVEAVDQDGTPKAKLTLEVNPRYISAIPENVDAQLKATTVFGNKYVSFTSPAHPSGQHISSTQVIDATAVTTEFNTLFETVVSLSEKVDPIKLNATLTAAAQALDGLGTKFGQAIVNGNDILADLNPRQDQVRYDVQRLADLADVYAAASPDLWAALKNAVTTARTLNDQRANLDEALMASVGFGNTGADVFERGGPYLIRGAADLIPTSQLLNEYTPEVFCSIRKLHDVAPKVADSLGGNGYSLRTHTEILGLPIAPVGVAPVPLPPPLPPLIAPILAPLLGAANPYVYPDNLPRVNAHGGPEGKPGCWQTVTPDLWPAPYLVTDIGASIAPYNHFGLGSPLALEYVWGRQIGENTINP
jgi:phospholipid/cholesterol/gamma-HCH transport system substrate-binding protein